MAGDDDVWGQPSGAMERQREQNATYEAEKMAANFEEGQRQMAAQKEQERDTAEKNQRTNQMNAAIQASIEYERNNPRQISPPDAMPMPDLTPDRKGHLNNKQQALSGASGKSAEVQAAVGNRASPALRLGRWRRLRPQTNG